MPDINQCMTEDMRCTMQNTRSLISDHYQEIHTILIAGSPHLHWYQFDTEVTYEEAQQLPYKRGTVRTYLEDEILAHDSKVNLTEAGHALHMAHEGQQVWEQGQEDPEDD